MWCGLYAFILCHHLCEACLLSALQLLNSCLVKNYVGKLKALTRPSALHV